MSKTPVSSFGIGHQMKIYWDGRDQGPPALPVTIEKLRELARAALPPAAFAYIGGAGLEETMAANRSDFGAWRPSLLRPRHDRAHRPP